MRGRGLSAGATSGVADLTAESDDDDGVAQRKADWEAKATVKREWLGQQQAAADLAKSAMQRVGEGVQKLLEQHLAREEAAKKARAGFHWDRSRIFTPAGWGGVDLGYVLDVTRCLTVVGAFDETRDDWGYQTANAAGVERYLRLFASAQSFELRVLWLLLAVECMHLARVSFHRFDEFKGAMRELHERDRLERWTMNVGWIELCNDETLFEYLVAAWSSVWASPTASSSTLAREDAQVAARLSAARPVNPFAGYNPPLGPQQDGQVTEAERQAAADYRAGARAVAAPQQVLGPMSRTATPGAPGEEEKLMAAEEEEPPRDPEDRLPWLHRS
ncbi:hypothetical protein DYB26_006908 [Aphanomyces astaci]|uniref:Uncharacterized protein n=2 Tax=Aphanomyces astaci TaxID=112090 RepID=A0A3R7CB97_APHAT|nr:hypothetical protein DYB26_006908 [Aphanomyces astaci]